MSFTIARAFEWSYARATSGAIVVRELRRYAKDRKRPVKNTTTVDKKEDIERLLKHGLAPITTNRDALIELGFTQGDPSLSHGYEASIWERSVDHSVNGTGERARRAMARERAYLVR